MSSDEVRERLFPSIEDDGIHGGDYTLNYIIFSIRYPLFATDTATDTHNGPKSGQNFEILRRPGAIRTKNERCLSEKNTFERDLKILIDHK